MTIVAEVFLWGTRVGAVAWEADLELGFFEYDPKFLSAPVEIAPLTLPRRPRVFSFPELARNSYHGLPGLLADSIPDRFGNLLIDRWLEERGRDVGSFTPVERLCYVGRRGMGALEYRPALRETADQAESVEVAELVRLANRVLNDRARLNETLSSDSGAHDASSDRDALRQIIAVGTSAGGARAKAVVAWNEATGEIRSGQADAPRGFQHWLLKFDGVAHNADKELADPQGFGRVEYAYSSMAKAAGIEMTECRLLEENERAHFMTRRFDRTDDGDKLHMQSLCAIAHYDFNQAGAYSYEQAFSVARRLGLDASAREEMARRMMFNVLARNQDDHTKNIAFLMNRSGEWTLSPAYDVMCAYNPRGDGTSRHRMALSGKRDGFTRDDLLAAAAAADLRPRRARSVLADVEAAVERWPEFAEAAGVSREWVDGIGAAHRRLPE